MTGVWPRGRLWYCQVLLYTKMLKETKTEETIEFFATFLSSVTYMWLLEVVPEAHYKQIDTFLAK